MSKIKEWCSPDYLDEAERILEWNLIANSGGMNLSPAAVELQDALIQEEGKEVFQAYLDGDLAEFTKELCDLFVVTSYRIYLEGVILDKTLRVDEIFTLTLQERDKLPTVLMDNLVIALENNWCHAIIDIVIGLLSALDVDGREALNLVIDNNFEKFESYVDDAWPTEGMLDDNCHLLEDKSKGRYKDITWEVASDTYIVYKDSNGKIMKPLMYTKLDLAKELGLQGD